MDDAILKNDEILGLIIASQQNIAFYHWLTRTAREQIIEGNFVSWKNNFLENYLSS